MYVQLLNKYLRQRTAATCHIERKYSKCFIQLHQLALQGQECTSSQFGRPGAIWILIQQAWLVGLLASPILCISSVLLLVIHKFLFCQVKVITEHNFHLNYFYTHSVGGSPLQSLGRPSVRAIFTNPSLKINQKQNRQVFLHDLYQYKSSALLTVKIAEYNHCIIPSNVHVF